MRSSLQSIVQRSAFSVLFLLVSCTTKPPATQPANDRSDAMKDPFGYSPWTTSEKNDISGGGINEFDREGMKRDINHLLDP